MTKAQRIKEINEQVAWLKAEGPEYLSGREVSLQLAGLQREKRMLQGKKKPARRRRRKNPGKPKKWEQGAIRRPGHADRLLFEEYGTKAFYADGDIKLRYLDRLINEYRRRRMKSGWWNGGHADFNSLVLARTFIEQDIAKGVYKHSVGKPRKNPKR